MLDGEGLTWREPWIEAVASYQSTGLGLDEAVRASGNADELASFTRQGLMDFPNPDLFLHQADSLRASSTGRNVVVTAGTGSGKTESFLLPVFASLLKESTKWKGSSPESPRWWREKGHWQPQRRGETGRSPGVRALVLYPMNALVEDQLVRLRKSLDSPAARSWLDENRNGHRFYFGRYTGSTPVSGEIGNSGAESRLKRYLIDVASRSERVEDDPQRRYFIQRTDGAEMQSRWDMQVAPPDILITNYSMLSIVLLRAVDSGLLDHTRQWLEESPDHVFHVVVDELHMYRGTAGTEVALLIRNLLNRLGLTPDLPQVRFIATSASLGEREESLTFRNCLGRFGG